MFHAIVAQNMMHDWLQPKLYRQVWLAFDPYHWQANNIWLHKPPMAMWMISASFSIFGDTPWALRFPSVLFSAGAMWLVFRIGRRLVSPVVGLIAVLVLSLNVSLVRLVQGGMFSDHVDIQLLFWTCVSIDQLTIAWLDPKKSKRFVFAGIAAGLALLSKSFPALISVGVLFSLAFLAWWWKSSLRISRRALVVFTTSMVLTIAPWFMWCWFKFNDLFRHELWAQLRHLDQDVEQWGAPWDRLLFDFLPRLFDMIWPLGVCASVLAIVRALRTRDLRLAAIVLWWFGALVPHLLAASKTPSGTLVGWPALALLIGWLVNDVVNRRGPAVGAMLACLLASFAWPLDLPRSAEVGYPPGYWFGLLAVRNQQVFWHILIGLLGALIFNRLRLRDQEWKIANTIIASFSLWVICTLGYGTWRITTVGRPTVAFPELRAVVEKLPENTVILLSNRTRSEHLIAMFWARRSCYDVPESNWQSVIDGIREMRGRPLVLTDSEFKGEVIAHVDGLNLIEPSEPSESK